MSKKRIEIIITSFLVLILIFVWLNSIKVLKKRMAQKVQFPVAAQSADFLKQELIGLGKEVFVKEEKEWNEDASLVWIRCPFCGKRYGEQEVEEEIVDLAVSGIIWDEVRPQAIINGQILAEGDSIGGFSIEKIEKQKVILSDGKKRIELNI